jgi:glutaredoxin
MSRAKSELLQLGNIQEKIYLNSSAYATSVTIAYNGRSDLGNDHVASKAPESQGIVKRAEDMYKRRVSMRCLVGAVLCTAAFAVNAQYYRWADESGRINFTDRPPPASAKNVQKKAGPPAPSTPSEPVALQQAPKNFPVTLYSVPGCEACDEARKLLNARGVAFREVSVTSQAQLEALKSAVGSNSGPALMLDIAGYP